MQDLFDKPAIRWALSLTTFLLIFLYHTFPLGLSDFWWHLNTGRWIWEHGAMPVDDPFLFSSASPLDARASLILRGYPLSQLLFLGSYTLGGAYALVLLKSLLMTLFYGLLWNQLRRTGLHSVSALAIVSLLPLLFFRFDELRPQVFSFLCTLLVLQWTEELMNAARQGLPLRRYALMLPAIMLLWANLHRGFIIGIGILLVYLFAEWLARTGWGRSYSNPPPLSNTSYRRVLLLAATAMLVALFNPVGYTATWASFTEVSGPFAQVIDEFLGTLRYFEFIGMKHIGYLIMAMAIVPALAMLIKWRKLQVAHLLLVLAFVATGILSFRFSLMMVAVVLVIASRYWGSDVNRWLGSIRSIPLLLLWCAATGLLASSAFSRTSLADSPLEAGVFPDKAVNYLERAHPSGQIFNFFEYGGYLGWRLYPQKIFIDQRNLSWNTYEEYSQCWRGDYMQVFDKYRIGVVFYPVYERATGRPARLILALLNDPQWEIGYYDRQNIIFLKADMNVRQAMLDKPRVITDLMQAHH